MTIYVALLRGINVGGNNTVAMPKLKACFEKLGYTNVKTYINSGNILFASTEKNEEKIVKTIEDGILKTFKLKIPVVIRNLKEIQEVCDKASKNWTNDTEMKTDVLFLWKEVDKLSVKSKIKITDGVDTLIYVKGAVLWNVDRKHYDKSMMHKFIGTKIYKHMTARNINTTRKLLDMMKELSAKYVS